MGTYNVPTYILYHGLLTTFPVPLDKGNADYGNEIVARSLALTHSLEW